MGSDVTDPQPSNPTPVTIEISSALGTGSGTIATAQGKPNVNTVVVHWWMISLARGMDAFLATLLSATGVGGVTGLIPAKDFLHLMIASGSLALGAGVLAIVYDGQKQLRKWLQMHPAE